METIERRELQMKRCSYELLQLFSIVALVQRWCTPVLLSLFAASVFCSLLVGIRMLGSSSLWYGFLLWNLFLAWIPYLAARLLRDSPGRGKIFYWSCGIVWLLFFPNAPYIITDFVHLRLVGNSFFWFDLILLFSFALTGLALGFASLVIIHRLLRKSFGAAAGWIASSAVILLSSAGIYLGRFLRLNSWDPFVRPLELLEALGAMAAEPSGLFSFILSYSFFLCAAYGILNLLMYAREQSTGHYKIYHFQ